ncbi:PadR family transcriptional regulator [Merdimonas faecis]|uniref:PadR family transcriptional regulator n=1 Tax=Merdimonas faecis TaxID=1653435 RepID=UPI000863698D|nr:PadR family transcriptional regulator [Merdimonas faecis]
MYDRTQLNRGILEGCILKLLSEESIYGYKLIERLKEQGFEDIKAGTVYPILKRLVKQGFIITEEYPSTIGPTKKYYSLTNEGVIYLNEFLKNWESVFVIVNNILFHSRIV